MRQLSRRTAIRVLAAGGGLLGAGGYALRDLLGSAGDPGPIRQRSVGSGNAGSDDGHQSMTG